MGSKVTNWQASLRALTNHKGSFPYRLFALVMYERQFHPAMARELDRHFERLDRETGRNLLFFAPAAPFQHADRADLRAVRREERSPHASRLPDVLLALCEAWGIRFPSLPCLVVFTDLGDSTFAVVPSGAHQVADQLLVLGQIADQLDYVYNRQPEEPPDTEDLNRGIALAMSRGHTPSWTQSLAEPMQAAVSRLRTAVRIQGRAGPRPARGGSPLEAAHRLSLSLADRPTTALAIPSWDPVNQQRLRTCAGLRRVFAEFADPDASPVLLPALKAFEQEMSWSAGHFVRQQLGIDLPTFFDCHQEGAIALLRDPYPMDFNLRLAGGGWRAPSMGAICDAFHDAGSNMDLGGLLPSWRRFTQIRNQACHARQPVEMHRVDACLDELAQLQDTGVFAHLSDERDKFRGR